MYCHCAECHPLDQCTKAQGNTSLIDKPIEGNINLNAKSDNLLAGT